MSNSNLAGKKETLEGRAKVVRAIRELSAVEIHAATLQDVINFTGISETDIMPILCALVSDQVITIWKEGDGDNCFGYNLLSPPDPNPGQDLTSGVVSLQEHQL